MDKNPGKFFIPVRFLPDSLPENERQAHWIKRSKLILNVSSTTVSRKAAFSLDEYCDSYGEPQKGLRNLKSHFMKGIKMNKFIAALIAGLFAISVNASAADTPKADAKPAAEAAAPAAAPAAKAEKPAAPAKKAKKHVKKAEKKAEEVKPADAAK